MTIYFSQSVAAIVTAVASFYLRAKDLNPVERRVSRSLKRVVQMGLPETAPAGTRVYTRKDLLPQRRASRVLSLSCPARA